MPWSCGWPKEKRHLGFFVVVITVIVNDTAIRLGGVECAIPKSFLQQLTLDFCFEGSLQQWSLQLHSKWKESGSILFTVLIMCSRKEQSHFAIKFFKPSGWCGDLPNKNQCASSGGIHEKMYLTWAEDFQAFQKSFLLDLNAGKEENFQNKTSRIKPPRYAFGDTDNC